MKLLLTLLGFATMLLAPSVEAGVIDACVGGNGNLRLVSGRQDCKNNESHLQWNEVGPAGPQGLPGIDGIDGRDGREAMGSSPSMAKASCSVRSSISTQAAPLVFTDLVSTVARSTRL